MFSTMSGRIAGRLRRRRGGLGHARMTPGGCASLIRPTDLSLSGDDAPSPCREKLVGRIRRSRIRQAQQRLVRGFAFLLLTAPFLQAAAFAQELPPEALALDDAGRLSVAAPGSPPLSVDDPRWDEAPATRLPLHPQIAITPGSEPAPALAAEMRAISDGQSVALRIYWQDPGADHADATRTDHFADALALQFAQPDGDGLLPYIGMGEPDRPVAVWYWRAGRGAEHLEAHGFGSLERTAVPAPDHDARHDGEGWTVVLRGPLTGAPMVLALAVWDGAADQRNGVKELSAWHVVHVPGGAVQEGRYAALAAQVRVNGDPELGRRLFEARGCIACHRVPGGPDVAIGPDLRLAGAHHWPGYLRRMIEDPSAFIVPGAGYTVPGADGTPQSLMPQQQINEEELEHIIAWLAGLERPERNDR